MKKEQKVIVSGIGLLMFTMTVMPVQVWGDTVESQTAVAGHPVQVGRNKQNKQDRREKKKDHREDVRDHREDMRDRREDVKDRRKEMKDKMEDKMLPIKPLR